jgi:hypothetical protein
MKLMINQRKDMLTTDGLIMKKKKIMSMFGRKDSGAEAGRNQEETGVASKRQA